MLKSLLTKIAKSYTTKTYQKINIIRTPQEQYTLFMDTHEPLSKLFDHLKGFFPNNEFISVKEPGNKVN